MHAYKKRGVAGIVSTYLENVSLAFQLGMYAEKRGVCGGYHHNKSVRTDASAKVMKEYVIKCAQIHKDVFDQ